MQHAYRAALAPAAANMVHLFLAMGLLVFASVHLSGCAVQEQESQQEPGRQQAWETMTFTVAEQLGNPENLTFPANGVNDVTYLGNNRYQITSYADYNDTQGGRERAYFYGVVIFRDNSWIVETIKFSR